MDLADMLSYSDIHSLNRIAKHYNLECHSNSKNALIQAILNAVNRKDVVEKTIKSLSESDLRFLNTFLFEQREMFTLEELIARVMQVRSTTNQTSSQNDEKEEVKPRQILSQYKERGWLFNGVNAKTKYLFQFPDDLKKKFSHILKQQFERKLIRTEEPNVYRDEHRLILDDLLTFLQYVQKEDITLTGDGALYKRQLQQVLELMSVQENLPEKAAWRFGYGRKFKFYPERFSFIYDYCFFSNYISEHENRLTLTEKGLARVAQQQKEDLDDLYRFWLKLYKSPVYNLPAIVHWVEKLSQTWVTVQSLKEVLCPFVKAYYYDSAEDVLEKRVLKMLLHLGLIRAGSHPHTQEGVIQMTKRGRMVVQGIYVSDEEAISFET